VKDLKVKKVSCGYEHTAVLTEDGTVLLFGSNEYGQCNESKVKGLKAKQVSCGF